jgi:pimeloyl-ACP methyl ester carboxylesterase
VLRAKHLTVLLVPVILAGCGGSSSPSRPAAPSVRETSVGRGTHQVWLFEPASRKPKAMVVFVHGRGDAREDTPYYHGPWLRHLAAQGNAVLYPRYETVPGDSRALRFLYDALPPAAAKLPEGLPIVLIGYSRGGGLAVDYTALAPQIGTPRAVLAVFPILLDPRLHLRSIPPSVRFLFLVGDRDTQVGAEGARDLLQQLITAGYPRGLLRAELVRSRGDFKATHLSVLDDTPGAHRAFWLRADRLISAVTR